MNLYTSSSPAVGSCHRVKLPSVFKAGLSALMFLIAKSMYGSSYTVYYVYNAVSKVCTFVV